MLTVRHFEDEALHAERQEAKRKRRARFDGAVSGMRGASVPGTGKVKMSYRDYAAQDPQAAALLKAEGL